MQPESGPHAVPFYSVTHGSTVSFETDPKVLKSVRVHFAAGSKALRGIYAATRHNWHD